MSDVSVKEVPIETAAAVGKTIVEFDQAYPVSHYTARYQDKKHLVIVGYVDDKPAGYMVGYQRHDDGSFYCWMAGVNPAYRGQGVLRAMMDYQSAWAKRQGYHTLKIKTRNNRREMLSYLVKYGFLFTKVEPAADVQDNRIYLQKPL